MSKGRRELWPLLDRMAQAALDLDFGSWPFDPVLEEIEPMLAGIEHLARSILRCYRFPSTEGLGGDEDWPWRAERTDGSRRWRPIGPDWVPEPYEEWLTTGGGNPVRLGIVDEPVLPPDLRPSAFRLLYWNEATREALRRDDTRRLLRAAWRTSRELAAISFEIQAGTAAKLGGKQIMNGIFNGPKAAPSPATINRAISINDRLIEGGMTKQAERIRTILRELGEDDSAYDRVKKQLQREERRRGRRQN